jgi:hypothetical protein
MPMEESKEIGKYMHCLGTFRLRTPLLAINWEEYTSRILYVLTEVIVQYSMLAEFSPNCLQIFYTLD